MRRRSSPWRVPHINSWPSPWSAATKPDAASAATEWTGAVDGSVDGGRTAGVKRKDARSDFARGSCSISRGDESTHLPSSGMKPTTESALARHGSDANIVPVNTGFGTGRFSYSCCRRRAARSASPCFAARSIVGPRISLSTKSLTWRDDISSEAAPFPLPSRPVPRPRDGGGAVRGRDDAAGAFFGTTSAGGGGAAGSLTATRARAACCALRVSTPSSARGRAALLVASRPSTIRGVSAGCCSRSESHDARCLSERRSAWPRAAASICVADWVRGEGWSGMLSERTK